MRKLIFAVALVCSSAGAWAKPVYLTCNLGGDPIPVALNEDAGTVTYSPKSGATTVPANFAPDFVTWGTKGMLSTEFKIDRTSLKFTRSYQVVNNEPMISEGKCKIAPQKRRAF